MYDKIGIDYNKTRRADFKVFDKIYELLGYPENKRIIDIGAGTGNYANLLAEKGNKLIALEPSHEMIKQSTKIENVEWINGFAEDIPLGNENCDKAICILSIHHFNNLRKSFNEIGRIIKSGGDCLIYTYIPQEQQFFWLQDYFPSLFKADTSKFPNSDKLKELLGESGLEVCNIVKFEIYYDLQDNFLATNWRKPENYLKKDIRNGISTFRLLDTSEVDKGVTLLKTELDNGNWHEKYGEILEWEYFDAGYRFIKAIKRE